MIVTIIQLLIAAGFTDVIAYGDVLPPVPYVVVKPEKNPSSIGTTFRITTHRSKSMQIQLDLDITKIINTLENTLEYQSEDFYPGYIPNSDDSLSREITFLMVSKY